MYSSAHLHESVPTTPTSATTTWTEKMGPTQGTADTGCRCTQGTTGGGAGGGSGRREAEERWDRSDQLQPDESIHGERTGSQNHKQTKRANDDCSETRHVFTELDARVWPGQRGATETSGSGIIRLTHFENSLRGAAGSGTRVRLFSS